MLDGKNIVRTIVVLVVLGLFLSASPIRAEAPLSDATQGCLECHASATPGIVSDWKRSRHFSTTPAQALKNAPESRRVSAEKVPEALANTAVGCAECHNMNPESHTDSFEHETHQVHSVVTPRDCATCHPLEVEEFRHNKMAWAHKNLTANPTYQDLTRMANGVYTLEKGKLAIQAGDDLTGEESCLACHGTVIEKTGMVSRETDFGDFEFPVLKGWPNQGVGRVNPDGSRGACTACHTRHQFSIKTARKPYTCGQCHKGPDVPAYKVYQVSKHGNLFSTHSDEWDFGQVPWVLGRDFTAPTCAVCHISGVVDEEGQTWAKRSHRMNDRLPWRLLGLVYAHPQPEKPDTSIIKNKAGLGLPTELTGEYVSEFLIKEDEMTARAKAMQRTCQGCHSQTWVAGHWGRLENTIKTSNRSTKTATEILFEAWKKGTAVGPDQKGSPFDEPLERKWVEQWLFYANTVRLASAMSGADYGVFANGRWPLTKGMVDMTDWLDLHNKKK